jgi:hypothetical protein
MQPIKPYVPATARFLIVVTFLEGELFDHLQRIAGMPDRRAGRS